jgi:hypothetical protein
MRKESRIIEVEVVCKVVIECCTLCMILGAKVWTFRDF